MYKRANQIGNNVHFNVYKLFSIDAVRL